MRHPTTRLLFSHWDAARGERAAPDYRDIDPGALGPALADLFVVERAPGTVRLAGSRCSALFGRDLKGAAVEDLWEPSGREAIRSALVAVAGGAGLLCTVSGATDGPDRLDLEVLFLPLRTPVGADRRAIGSLAPLAAAPWLGLTPLRALATRSIRSNDPLRRRWVAYAALPPDPARDRGMPLARPRPTLVPAGRGVDER